MKEAGKISGDTAPVLRSLAISSSPSRAAQTAIATGRAAVQAAVDVVENKDWPHLVQLKQKEKAAALARLRAQLPHLGLEERHQVLIRVRQKKTAPAGPLEKQAELALATQEVIQEIKTILEI
jgi:translation initiation factor 2B subunit (eIF-2B alpha/beta/delta family)